MHTIVGGERSYMNPPLVRSRTLSNVPEGTRKFVAFFGFRLPLPARSCPLDAFARAHYGGVLDAKIIERYATNWNAMKGFASDHKRKANQALKAGNAPEFNAHVHAWMACRALASRHASHASLLDDFQVRG